MAADVRQALGLRAELLLPRLEERLAAEWLR